MGKHSFSLKTIYLAALTAVFGVSFLAFAVFDFYSQQRQTEAALLEEARTFAREMDAVWQFMDNSQSVINNTSDGTYEFKGLHCSLVGKSVGRLFSAGSDYAIRYTNFNPRSEQDIPDEFEAEALERFNANSSVKEHYGIAEYQGEERFRYLQALEVDNSCLSCHGEPAGELDVTGKEKEGWTLDSVGGAISIVIPIDQQQQTLRDNVIRDVVFFLGITVFIGAVIYVVTTFFVLRPIGGLHAAFGKLKRGRMDAELGGGHAAKEVQQLVGGFNDMAGDLRDMYEHLESQVEARTIDLQEANALLEHQRDKLEKLNESLEQETRFKSDLLSMVNHELRTPLTSIITFAQISRETCDPGRESDRRSWEEIEKNSQILLNMINNMLDIARSDAGSIKSTCEPMDLGDVAASVKGTMAPLARKYEVSFRTRVASDVPLVNGDYEKTLRMLENLASNAIKFTPDGGSVELRVAYDENRQVVTLSMVDTGIGIAPEDQERIFERFFQVDSTSTRKYNGSGLGLALVREYADMQGFAISVESEVGKGSAFVITVPKRLIVGEDDV
ncbi:histidine kinase [Paraeggerthella hongkongensis]|uniref:ATP-binding protein n=1 Tax=Paraeggerthella sp. TaxID=2897350 RepID=UPI000DF82E07|nr:histidine kinase [Paraeggerthella hongkongensis]